MRESHSQFLQWFLLVVLFIAYCFANVGVKHGEIYEKLRVGDKSDHSLTSK